MTVMSWAQAPRCVTSTERTVSATALEVSREVVRAAAALAGLVAWGTLLVLLAA
jgi:hypothetical protein